MDGDFVRSRITELRIQKGVSEYKMSMDLGHSKSYIQGISSGRALPSLPEFLYICDYFKITPKEFFDEEVQDPVLINELLRYVSQLKTDDIKALIHIAERLNAK